ncbi:MAG: hypothetical protein ACPHYE_07600 [Henriciella sp.]
MKDIKQEIMTMKRAGFGWEDVALKLNITQQDQKRALRKFFFAVDERRAA